MKLLTCVTMLLLAAPSSAAQPARDTLVVSAAWLQQHVNDPNLVLLHVGNKETYDAGHLPGARYVDYRSTLAAVEGANGLTLEMLPADVLHDRLAALGLSDTSRVVVYQSDEMWTPSTRVMLTLDYAGLSNVSWLDGGQKAWTAAGGSLTPVIPPQKPGALSALRLRPVVADADFVNSHLHTPSFAIVDARSPAFYDGSRTGGRAPAEHKTGHIAGAVNVPFDSFTTQDVQLKPVAEIAAAFTKAGVKPGDTVITYCHIGQQATATLFAARTLGYRVMLYDGSFEDWSRRNLPVENPSAKKHE
ncbi:MAG TPA: rhodanese-like domain-containing protein [Vicinamibacterales bacterium]|nr:rhodanese-like domain-containing protein [Vicinamibacterales bacterium]